MRKIPQQVVHNPSLEELQWSTLVTTEVTVVLPSMHGECALYAWGVCWVFPAMTANAQPTAQWGGGHCPPGPSSQGLPLVGRT